MPKITWACASRSFGVLISEETTLSVHKSRNNSDSTNTAYAYDALADGVYDCEADGDAVAVGVRLGVGEEVWV